MQSDYQGLYSTGELYTFETTHEVDSNTGASLSVCKIKFKTQTESFSLGYDLSTGFFEEGDDNDYVALHPSSSASPYGSNGGKKIIWKLIVNANWDDQNRLVILSETIADNNVVGMLSGVVLEPVGANAIENDIRINNLSLFKDFFHHVMWIRGVHFLNMILIDVNHAFNNLADSWVHASIHGKPFICKP